jgi:integrase/recombinase XerD
MKSITIHQPTQIEKPEDIRELVNAWHAHLTTMVRTGELSENTRQAYSRSWGKFIKWLLEQDINQVDGDTIRQWIADLREAGSKPNTINVLLSGVRAFFSWAVGTRRLAINPTEGVKSAKRNGTGKTHLRDALTNAEVRRVLSQPDRDTPAGQRDYAILMLKAYTAARDIELHRADLADLRTQNDKLVLYVRGKGHELSDELIVLAHPAVEDAVYDWLTARGSKPGPLFTSLSNRAKDGRLSLRSIRRLVKDSYKAAGVKDDDQRRKTSHSLRHTAITNAIRHGAPVQKVKSMARHASIETTMVYYHEVDRVDNPAEQFIDYSNGNGEGH